MFLQYAKGHGPDEVVYSEQEYGKRIHAFLVGDEER